MSVTANICAGDETRATLELPILESGAVSDWEQCHPFDLDTGADRGANGDSRIIPLFLIHTLAVLLHVLECGDDGGD